MTAESCLTVNKYAGGVFHFFLMGVGLAIIAIGSYVVLEVTYISFLGSNFGIAGYLILTTGFMIIIISVVGLVGTVLRWRPVLVIHAVIQVVIILMLCGGGAYSVVIRDSIGPALQETYSMELRAAMRAFRATPDSPDYDESINKAVDQLQTQLRCCGGTAPSDWEINTIALITLNNSLPDSCLCTPSDSNSDVCGKVEFFYNTTTDGTQFASISQNAYTMGCIDAAINSAMVLAYTGVATTFVVLVFAIIGVIFSTTLVCCITYLKLDWYAVY